MTLSLEKLLQEIEALREVARHGADTSLVQTAAINRLADTAKKLGEIVKSRTPNDAQVATAIEELTGVITDLVDEVGKVKKRVTALALHHRAIAPDDVTGVHDIPKDEPKRPDSKPPGPYLVAPGGWRIPLIPLLRYAGVALTSGGLGALIKHFLSNGGHP